MIATLKLDPARTQLISGFIDTYLRLNEQQEREFETELKSLGTIEEEKVMEIVTSWMEKGIEQGIEQGRQLEANLLIRQLKRRIGSIPENLSTQVYSLSVEQLENLGEALLDFTSQTDLDNWLKNIRSQ